MGISLGFFLVELGVFLSPGKGIFIGIISNPKIEIHNLDAIVDSAVELYLDQ